MHLMMQKSGPSAAKPGIYGKLAGGSKKPLPDFVITAGKVSFKDLTMDHLVPLARGGRSTKDNLVPCCKDCNNLKKSMLPLEWEDYLLKMVQEKK